MNDGQVLTNKPQELINLLIVVNVLTDINPDIATQFSLDTELTQLLQVDKAKVKLCVQYLNNSDVHYNEP